jgi:uncharacterized RDD family membrane protein YckC
VSPDAGSTGELPTPGIWRRLACFLYEGVLLFGLVMTAGLVYGIATQQRHALVGSTGLQVFMLLVLAAYFVHFWSRSGQTLAMLTWHIRLVTAQGEPVSRGRALARYLLSWIWFLPALATVHFSGLKGAGPTLGAVLAGVLAYAALARLHPDRQYWHDALCGTRLVTWRPVRKKP